MLVHDTIAQACKEQARRSINKQLAYYYATNSKSEITFIPADDVPSLYNALNPGDA
jgi:hypothetical protein